MVSAQDIPQDDDPFENCSAQLAAVTSCYGDEWAKLPTCLECAFDGDTTLCSELGTLATDSYEACVQEGKCDANCDEAMTNLGQCMLSDVNCDEQNADLGNKNLDLWGFDSGSCRESGAITFFNCDQCCSKDCRNFGWWWPSFFKICNPVPSDIACPAMRFLLKWGIENDKFTSFGPSGDGGYNVDAVSLKNLVSEADALGFNFVDVEDGVSVFARAFDGAIDSQTVDGSVDITRLQEHFDHGASTGIIGAATIGGTADHDSFNRDKYDEVLAILKNGDDSKTMFTEVDFGRVVKDFGSGAVQTADVGGFSWAVLGFEYANLFFGFKQFDENGNPYVSLDNFEALFLNGGSTGATFDKNRSGGHWSLQETICKMEIGLTETAIVEMTEESNANFFNLFNTLCGEGFERCKDE